MNIERILNYCDKEESGCWIWKGATAGQGYGRVIFNSKPYYVHRLLAEVFIAPLKPTDVVHHKCNNKLCINPEHLEVVDSIKTHMKTHNMDRNRQINIKVTHEEYNTIKNNARNAGLPMATYIRQRCI